MTKIVTFINKSMKKKLRKCRYYNKILLTLHTVSLTSKNWNNIPERKQKRSDIEGKETVTKANWAKGTLISAPSSDDFSVFIFCISYIFVYIIYMILI